MSPGDIGPSQEARAISRRTFLKVGAGTFAALVAHQAFALDALAHSPPGYDGLRVLNPEQAAIFEAIAARIWPGTPEDPGARDAGALYYLDGALAGPYADQREAYFRGLANIDAYARRRYDRAFLRLSEAEQDEVLVALESGSADGFTDPRPQQFFDLCRRHTLEGVFSDPIYGGNREFAGWKVVEYPGPYYVYTAAEQQSFEPLNKPFQSVADL